MKPTKGDPNIQSIRPQGEEARAIRAVIRLTERLTPEEKAGIDAALREYAATYGTNWKDRLLRDDWPRCAPAGWLINLRNRDGGFEYVYAFKP